MEYVREDFMEQDKISVIIPVYNVEKYFSTCMETVLNQTYKNLEIILVDDESTDNSGKMCDEYAKKDSRVKVVHKKNEGAASARNAGLDIATGEYIGFIDSDDFVELDFYEVLYKCIIEENADLAMCRLVDCYGTIEKVEKKVQKYVWNTEEAIKIVLEAKLTSVTPVNKLYKKFIFDKLRYESCNTAEDAEIIIDILMKCKKIVFLDDEKYFYIHRENSVTTRKFDKERGYDVIYAYQKNYKLIENNYPSLSDIAEMRICWANFCVLDRMILSVDTKIDMNLVKYLRKRFLFIMKNNCFTKVRKLSMILLMVNVNLYKIIVKKFNEKNRKLYS